MPLALKVLKEQRVLLQASRDVKVYRVQQASKAVRESKVLVHQEPKALKAHQVFKVLKARKEITVR